MGIKDRLFIHKYQPVYFDDFNVTHTRGALVDETAYYPFGLKMAGISSTAAVTLENNHKFNDGCELESNEFSDGTGLDLYSTEFRKYDAQIGRFNQIDQLTDYYQEYSPYSYTLNNPVNFNDPSGLEAELPNFNNAEELLNYIQQNGLSGFGTGFTSYSFGGANGETTSVNYDPNPRVGVNKDGQAGIWVKWSYSQDDGYLGLDKIGQIHHLNSIVIGPKFIEAGKFLDDWDNYSNYVDQNSQMDAPAYYLGVANLYLSSVQYTRYAQLPQWAGGKGWWVGKNMKFNNVGWGGNGATGGRSVAKALSTKIGYATTTLGIVTVGVSVFQAVNDFSHGNTKAGVIHSADAIMGVVGMCGPIGAAVSGIYFVSRFFWGND